MTKLAYAIVTLSLFGSVVINNFAGNPRVKRDLVSVRFCPPTANVPEKYGRDEYEKSQKKLDTRFCKSRYILDKEYFQENSALDNLPDLEVTPYRKNTTKDANWLLLTPLLIGVGYSAFWASLQNTIDNAGLKLEKFKLTIKERNSPLRVQRELLDHSEEQIIEFQKLQTEIEVQEEKRDNGWINQDELDKGQQIREKQFELVVSEMDAKVAEFRATKQKHENERLKLERIFSKKTTDDTTTTGEKIDKTAIKKDIEKALKEHEGGWLYEVICNIKPLVIIGEMGSGKSWFAVSVGLTRKAMFDANVEFIMDRHYQGDNAEVWQLLDAKHKAKNEYELTDMFQKSRDHWATRIAKGKKNIGTPTQTFVDEFTNLRAIKEPETVKEAAEVWFSMALTDPRKGLDYVTIITHKDTNAAWGHGNKDQREANTILIEKYSKDGFTPLPRVRIVRGLKDEKGNSLTDIEKTAPDWFNPQTLREWIENGTMPEELKTE